MEKAIGQKGELVASLFAIWCCYCTLLLHPYSQCIRLSEKRFYSVIQSYFIITDFLQNCQKSILVYQVLISLNLNVCTVPKSPCRISILPTSPSAFHWQYKSYIFRKCNFVCTSKLIDIFDCSLINWDDFVNWFFAYLPLSGKAVNIMMKIIICSDYLDYDYYQV